jgi:hypothetical protein
MMKIREFRKTALVFICFSLIILLLHQCVSAATINLSNWTIDALAYREPNSVPVYIYKNDFNDTGSIIEVAKSPYISGLSSIVLIKHEKGQAFGYVAGTLTSHENHLILIKVTARNTGKELNSFRIGNISLMSADRVELPYVAVAKGDSYLIAKTTLEAWKASKDKQVSVDPNNKINIDYCFVVPPGSYPIRLNVKNQKTDFSFNYQNLKEYKRESSSAIVRMVGKLQAAEKFEGQKMKASLVSNDTDICFDSPITVSPGELGAELGVGSGRSLDRTEFLVKKLGKESSITLRNLYMFGSGVYVPGTISVLKRIEPFEIILSFDKPKIRAIFKASFQADEGDVIAAMGPIKQIDNPVLSTDYLNID